MVLQNIKRDDGKNDSRRGDIEEQAEQEEM